MTKNDVLRRLQEGNRRFVEDKLNGQLQDKKRRHELEGSQHPYAIILSCADSRVVPELTFDAGLGELFVIRVAGNIANSSTIASIEYAVAHLGTEIIMVLGHQSCGAVGAALQGGDNGYNLNHLVSHISPAVVAAGEGASTADVVKENAKYQMTQLIERSSIIRNAINNGQLELVPAYYNLDTGVVDLL